MRRNMGKGRLLAGLAMAAFALFSYFGSGEENAITGETQYLAYSPQQEIALGLRAAPAMAQQHGGLYSDKRAQRRLDRVGLKLVNGSVAQDTNWRYEFHLLADAQTINAFALPGGQIFITYGLYSKLRSDDEIAGVLSHEMGHVIARHGAQQVAKQQLTQGLTGAAVIASGDARTGQMAAMIGKLVTMRYGRGDEIESDLLGVRFMVEAGYQPEAMIRVMEVLKEAGGGGGQAEFFSTHPNPDNRIARIKEAIQRAKSL